MGWPETIIEDWSDLSALFEGLRIGRTGDLGWIFRGQADASWDLRPSLSRLLGDYGISHKRAHGIEFGVFRRFTAVAHIHFGVRAPRTDLGPSPAWWMLMQHHHCPTRVLDWTESPYVAAYFAVEQSPDVDGAVWMLPSSPLDTASTGAFGELGEALDSGTFFSESPTPAVYPVAGLQHSDRSVAQQGVYTVAADILADHAPLVEAAFVDKPWALQSMKIVIPSTLKHEALCRLRSMNITASALFPGPDGVGRAASEYVRIRVWDTRSEAT